jgi:hypothetical protein
MAAALASRNLDSVSESYIEDDFPQTGFAIEAPPPLRSNCTKKSINLTRPKAGPLSDAV